MGNSGMKIFIWLPVGSVHAVAYAKTLEDALDRMPKHLANELGQPIAVMDTDKWPEGETVISMAYGCPSCSRD
jgi:hypothetical protein